MIDLQRIPLPYGAHAISATSTGHIVVQMRTFRKLNERSALACFDMSGKLVWRRKFKSIYRPGMRIANDSIWLHTGKQILRIDSDGVITQTIEIRLDEKEFIGDFLVTTDGLYVCTTTREGLIIRRSPRVVGLSEDGKQKWSIELPIPHIEYEGVDEIGEATNWEVRPKKPWVPRAWTVAWWEPFLATRNRLLATYHEVSSGLGISYCINTESAQLIWTTPPHPTSRRAIAGEDRFLIGSQGYGAFDMWLYSADGKITQEWKSHGCAVITEQSEIRVVEMENRDPSNVNFSILEPSGEVRKGPRVPRYRTAYPSVDQAGTAVFWRKGEVFTVDADLNLRSLYNAPLEKPHHTWATRTLLPQPDTLVFGISQGRQSYELWIFHTPLKPLANSVWPCGDGNLGGNPVLA